MEAYHFMFRRCPICSRVRRVFRMLELEGLLRPVEIDIEASKRHPLLDRYNYFVKRILGGKREVPVILIGEKWYIPKRRSRAGEIVPFSEEIKRSIEDLEREIRDDLEGVKPKPSPFPSHRGALERLMR